ncbi:discoidin domain-containing protein [Sphingobacterium sp. HSC-15S19]|uniref:discoidin domain-containing protein n=1 Tax=Sphingobacterium sp. HSC-15S19 TaxID=2910971 RepID=UPI003D254CE2
MKYNIGIFALLFLAIACKKEEIKMTKPPQLVSVEAEPRIGGTLLKWKLPSDNNYLYGQITYKKAGSKDPDKIYKINISSFADTMRIDGLINKYEYVFNVQLFNQDKKTSIGGDIISSNSVRPIVRPSEVTYFPNELTKIQVTDNMVETYTQESSEGPKKNLFDGDKNTYWHTAWSANTAPLPHWIQLNFPQEEEIGAIKYFFRQNNSDEAGRPKQWGIEISSDGKHWTRVFTSKDNLPTSNVAEEQSLAFDKNYKSKFFRLMILKNGGKSYTHLGEMNVYRMRSSIIDKEKEAEDNY